MMLLPLNRNTLPERMLVGGKGAALLELVRMNLPVPPGMIVTAMGYETYARGLELEERLGPLVSRQDWDGTERTAYELFLMQELDAALTAELRDRFCGTDAPLAAVRSSATCEDMPDASFAGQYETFLNVCGEAALSLALRKCWASLWNRRALSYRHRLGLDHFAARMAVVIQEMVIGEASGVLFTRDPMNNGDTLRVEVAPGLGEAVVSGAVAGDVYSLDRTSFAPTVAADTHDLLPPELLVELCRIALRIEKRFGCAQDIEFTVRGDTLFLLQARPMTVQPSVAPEPLGQVGPPSIMDRMVKPFVDERYAVAPRPLDNIVFNVLVGTHIHVAKQCGAVISPPDEAAFRAQIWRQAYRLPPFRRKGRALLRSVMHQFSQLAPDWQRWWEGGPRQAMIETSTPVDLGSLSEAELFARAERILAVWEGFMNTRISAASALRSDAWLNLLVSLAVGSKRCDGVMASLMAGLPNPTFELNEEMWRLSRLVRKTPAVRAAVHQTAPELLNATPEGRELLTSFAAFLVKYGHREGSCWYLSTPTWGQDPRQAWRLLDSLAESDVRAGNPEETRARREAATAEVERRLRVIPGLAGFFRWLLNRLCALHAFRESSHFDLTRPLAALQAVASEWGRRLVAKGLLDRQDDVSYLTYEEVRAWLLDAAPGPENIQRLLASRRATYRLVNARWQAERFGRAVGGDVLKGVAASPGAARGRVRLVRGEHEFGRLRPGDVLVSPYTNPAWTPLFATAAAVVTETGGVSSHAAIVAREYGIPAVMAVPGATRVLRDGQDIFVDGNRGVVLPGALTPCGRSTHRA